MIEFLSMYAQPAGIDYAAFKSVFTDIKAPLTPVHFVLRVESTLADPVSPGAVDELHTFAKLFDELPDHFGAHLELAGDLVPAFVAGTLPDEIYDLSLDCLRLRLDGTGQNVSVDQLSAAMERERDHHFVLRHFPEATANELIRREHHFALLHSSFLNEKKYAFVPQGISFDGLNAALGSIVDVARDSLRVRSDWVDIGDVASSDTGWSIGAALNAVCAMSKATTIGINRVNSRDYAPSV